MAALLEDGAIESEEIFLLSCILKKSFKMEVAEKLHGFLSYTIFGGITAGFICRFGM